MCVCGCVCVYRACDYTGMHMSMHCLRACLSVCEPKYFLHVYINLRTNPHAPVRTRDECIQSYYHYIKITVPTVQQFSHMNEPLKAS